MYEYNPLAFPVHAKYEDETVLNEGMTLRDYFAAKAMQGILSGYTHGSIPPTESLTPASYKIADAMLKARDD